MKTPSLLFIVLVFIVFTGCRKDDNSNSQSQNGSVIESVSGITYKLYKPNSGTYK